MKNPTVKTCAVVLLASALATPAFAETVGESTGVNSTLGIAPTTQDFVKEAAISDMFEIESKARPRSSPPRWCPITRRRRAS